MQNTTRSEDNAIATMSSIAGEWDQVARLIERLDNELSKKTEELDDSQSAVKSLSKDVEDLRSEIAELRVENDRLRRFNQEWIDERERLAKIST